MPVPADWSYRLNEYIDEWKRNPMAEKYIDGAFDNFVLTEHATSWDDLLAWGKELQDCWCFRGQREAEWSLLTSLDRGVRREFSSESEGCVTTGHYHLDREEEGLKRLVRFQEDVKRSALAVPLDGDSTSWLALAQHYGIETRLLDWTMSAFIAAYFALEDEARGESECSAVWALDLGWLEKSGRELLGAEAFAFTANAGRESLARWENDVIARYRKPVIIKVHPLENKRMVAQHGILLCKLFHEAFFSQTLMAMIIHGERPTQPVIRKLEVHTSNRTEILARLREADIHKAALFPDGSLTKGAAA